MNAARDRRDPHSFPTRRSSDLEVSCRVKALPVSAKPNKPNFPLIKRVSSERKNLNSACPNNDASPEKRSRLYPLKLSPPPRKAALKKGYVPNNFSPPPLNASVTSVKTFAVK